MRAGSGTNKDVVIVGAGPGGLASAMLLAKAGFNVKVLERRDRVGGRTSTVEAQGFRFDLGPTFFLYPRVLREIFEMCGRSLDDEVELLRLDPNYRLVFGEGGGAGSHLDVTGNVSRMEAELARFSVDDSLRLRAWLQDNRRKLDAFRPILESPFNSLRDILRPSILRALPVLRPLTSVDRDLRKFFDDPRIRLAFSFQSKYLGMSPFNCPSLFTILSFLEYEHGVFHPRGGCGAVTEAMARVAGELGAEILTDEPVEEIYFEGRRAVGVRTPRARYRCDTLTIGADFGDAMTRLVPERLRPRWTDAKLEKKRWSCSTYMMYLGLEGGCDDVAHHTIYLTEDYEENLADIETHHRLTEDPSIYVHNPCVTDGSMAPEGMTALYVLVPVTHQHPNVDWSVEGRAFRERVLDRLERLGIRDIRRRIRFEKTITPADWQSDMAIYRGATFNLAHSLDQMLHLRPRNRFADLDGVYLVGGGTHPGSGLPVIFESARITSRLIAEDLGRDPSWERVDSPANASGGRDLAQPVAEAG